MLKRIGRSLSEPPAASSPYVSSGAGAG
jgi:hypothetical protein